MIVPKNYQNCTVFTYSTCYLYCTVLQNAPKIICAIQRTVP